MTTTPPPRYVRIANALEARILSGEYPPGAQIPSYRDLMDGAAGTEHVSWATAVHAVALLVRKGLVDQPTNQGTRVSEHRKAIQRSKGYVGAPRTSWREAMAENGLLGSQEVVSAGRQQAPPDIAIRLELEPGSEVVVRERIMYGNKWPYEIARGYYPIHLAAGSVLESPRKMRANAMEALAQLGHPPTHFVEEVWGRTATPTEADLLRLPAGAVVLSILRTSHSADGPVEVAAMVCAGDRVSCRYEIAL